MKDIRKPQGEITMDFYEMSKVISSNPPKTKKQAILQTFLFAEYCIALGEPKDYVFSFTKRMINRIIKSKKVNDILQLHKNN